jgi:hypothetical protein
VIPTPLNPPDVLAAMVTAVELPRITLAEGADSDNVKSDGADAVGTSVANNPLVWAGPPAVKYRVCGVAGTTRPEHHVPQSRVGDHLAIAVHDLAKKVPTCVVSVDGAVPEVSDQDVVRKCSDRSRRTAATAGTD